MNIIEKFLTNNPCVTDGRYLNPPIGLALHSVGVPQPSALVFYNNENKPTAQAAVHGFVEPTGNAYQTLPWHKRGWHAGSGTIGSLNNYYIGIEMTEPAGIKYTTGANWYYTDEASAKDHIFKTYKYAVELFAYLCKEFGFDPLGYNTILGIKCPVIVSHAEAAALGLAYPHADVEHIWNKVGLTMDQFRQDVNAIVNPPAPPTPPEPEPPKERNYMDQIKVLYAEFLGRVADEEGLAHWNKVWNEDGFQKVYNGIAGSKEGKKHYVRGMYRDFLGREASAAEVNEWYPKTRLAIYNGIVNSAEYKKKHGLKGAKSMKASDIKAKHINGVFTNPDEYEKELPKPEKVKIDDISIGQNPIPVPQDPTITDK